MRTWFLFSAILFVLVPGSVFAYRPFMTEDAGVAGKGVFQTEMSWDYYQWKNGDRDQVYLLVAPIYGATENLELSSEISYVVHSLSSGAEAEGIGDVNLVAKYVLLWERYEKKDALLTLKGVIKLDSGNFEKGLGRGDTEYSLFPVFTKIIRSDLTVHGQFGYTFVTDKKDPNLRNYAFYGLAADYAVTDPFHFAIEFNAGQHPDRTQPGQRLALVGFIYTVNDHFVLDTSYKKGLSDSTPAWGFGVGAAIQF